MWQEILVIIIGIVVFGYAGYKVVRLFTKKNASPCAECTISCSIKDISLARKEDCDKKKENSSTNVRLFKK